jgi:hypothetical protein
MALNANVIRRSGGEIAKTLFSLAVVQGSGIREGLTGMFDDGSFNKRDHVRAIRIASS